MYFQNRIRLRAKALASRGKPRYNIIKYLHPPEGMQG